MQALALWAQGAWDYLVSGLGGLSSGGVGAGEGGLRQRRPGLGPGRARTGVVCCDVVWAGLVCTRCLWQP